MPEQRQPIQRVIVCAAIKANEKILVGARHFCPIMLENLKLLKSCETVSEPIEQGFIDQHGVFLDREQALEVAEQAGQINTRRPKTQPEDRLFSEDLY